MHKLELPVLIVGFLYLITPGCAQIITGPKPPAPPKPKPPVVRPRKPTLPTNGVLAVATAPAISKVIVKNEQNTVVDKGQTKDGAYQVELRPGAYTVEVTADKYLPQAFEIEIKQGKPTVVSAQLAPAFGSVLISLGSVGSEATILIDGQKPSSVTPKTENRIQIDNIPVGSHTLLITHPSIAIYESKIDVTGGVPTFVAPVFQVALTNLLIRSEPGAEIYVDGAMVGKTLDSGELRIPDRYKPGQHTVRAEKDFFEPNEEIKSLGIGDQIVEVKLTHIKSSPEFGDEFREGLTFWDAPSSWQLNRRILTVRGPEPGLVKGMNFVNFTMQFDIRFTNGKGAAWIIRARDKKNFYLFQLCGPKSANPKTFRSYVYKNGQSTMLNSTPMPEDLTRQDDIYTIRIEAKGSNIKHSIQLKSNPREGSQQFSTLIDSTFPHGTVGLGTVDGEEFVVYFVNITPN